MDSLKLSDIASELLEVATDEKDHFFEGVYGIGETDADPENSIPAMADYASVLDTPNEVILTQIYATKALQPGGRKTASGKVFNPTEDAITIEPKTAKVQHIALNMLFNQDDFVILKKSYLSDIRSKRISAEEIPFASYILDAIKKMANEELRLAYYQAIYNAQGTSFVALFDGWRKQFLDAITNSEIPAGNVIDTAVISNTNAVASFETIVKAIPTRFLSKVVCLVPRALKTMYEEDYRTRWGTLPWNDGIKKAKIQGTSIEFMVEPGLDGFTRPIFTPKNNMVKLFDSASDKADLKIDYDVRERDIAIVMDAQAGCGFANGKHIWTNDGV